MRSGALLEVGIVLDGVQQTLLCLGFGMSGAF